jgi:hypothetical protein
MYYSKESSYRFGRCRDIEESGYTQMLLQFIDGIREMEERETEEKKEEISIEELMSRRTRRKGY